MKIVLNWHKFWLVSRNGAVMMESHWYITSAGCKAAAKKVADRLGLPLVVERS